MNPSDKQNKRRSDAAKKMLSAIVALGHDVKLEDHHGTPCFMIGEFTFTMREAGRGRPGTWMLREPQWSASEYVYCPSTHDALDRREAERFTYLLNSAKRQKAHVELQEKRKVMLTKVSDIVAPAGNTSVDYVQDYSSEQREKFRFTVKVPVARAEAFARLVADFMGAQQ